MERYATGITGLDEMLGGGLLENSVTLVAGAPGTGKTTLGLQFIHAGITEYNQPGLIVTFEAFPSAFFRDAVNFGWDMEALRDQGKLGVLFTSPDVFLKDIDSEMGILGGEARRIGARRIIIDSASHFLRLRQGDEDIRTLLYKIINSLKRQGLTVVLTYEDVNILGGLPQETHDLPFLVDTMIMMRYIELDSALSKSIFVLKHRGSDHDKHIREMRITHGAGIEVASKFDGVEGLLSGSAHRSMEASFEKAFLGR